MSMTIENAADAAKIYQQLLDATENVQGKAEVTDDGKVAVTIQKADGTSTVLVVEVPDLDVPETNLEDVSYEEIAQKLETVLSEGLGLSQDELQEVMKNIENLVDAMVAKGLPGSSKKGVFFDIYQVMALLAQVAIEQKKAALLQLKAENAKVLQTMASEMDEAVFNARLGLGLTVGTTIVQTGATGLFSYLQGKAGATQLDEMTNSGEDVMRRMETQGNVIDNPDSLAKAEENAKSKLSKLSGADVRDVERQFASPEANARVEKHGEFNNQINEKREALNAEKTALDADRGQLAHMTDKNQKATDNLPEAEDELRGLQKGKKDLEDERAEVIDAANDAFASSNDDRETRINTLEEEIAQLKGDGQNISQEDQEQINSKKQELDALKSERGKSLSEFLGAEGNEDLKRRIEGLDKQIAEKQKEIDAKTAEINKYKEAKKPFEAKAKLATEPVQKFIKASDELVKLENDVVKTGEQIHDLDLKIVEAQSRNETHATLELTELKNAKNAVKVNLEGQITNKRAELRNLQNDIDKNPGKLKEEAKPLTDLEKRVEDGPQKVEHLKEEIANLEDRRKAYFDEGMGRVNRVQNPLDEKCMNVAKAEETLQDAQAEVRQVKREDVQREFRQAYPRELDGANKTLQVREPGQNEAQVQERKLSDLVAEGKRAWAELPPEQKAQPGNQDEAAFVKKYVMDRVNTQEPPALTDEDYANYIELANQGEEGFVQAKVAAAEEKVTQAKTNLAAAKEEVVKAANDAFGEARAEFDDVHNRYKEAQARGKVPQDLMDEHKLKAAKMEYANVKRLQVVSEYGTPEQKTAIKLELKGMHDRLQGELSSNLEIIQAKHNEQKWQSITNVLTGLFQGVQGTIQQSVNILDAKTRSFKIEEEELRQKIEQTKMVRDDADAALRDIVQTLRGMQADNSQMMNSLINF